MWFATTLSKHHVDLPIMYNNTTTYYLFPMRDHQLPLPPPVSAPKNYKHCSSFFQFEQVVGQLVVARRVLM
jgi:hypothetical protein